MDYAIIGKIEQMMSEMDFIAKLDDIEKLPENWDGDGAQPPSKNAIRIAKETILMIQQVEHSPRSVQATLDGGVVITFLNDNKHADLEFCEDGDAIVLMEDLRDRKETIFELSSSPSEIKKALGIINEYLATI